MALCQVDTVSTSRKTEVMTKYAALHDYLKRKPRLNLTTSHPPGLKFIISGNLIFKFAQGLNGAIYTGYYMRTSLENLLVSPQM